MDAIDSSHGENATPIVCAMSGSSLRLTLVGIALMLAVSTGCGDGADSAERKPSSMAISESAGELSEADLAKIAADLEQYAADNGVSNPPAVDIVRVTSLADWPQTYAQCLTEEGFPSTASGDGGVSTEIPPGQEEASNLASYECHAKYPVDPRQDGRNLTDAQKSRVFEYLTATLVECLEEHGYQISQVPSRDVFLSGFDQSPPWNPYNQVFAGNISASEGELLESECPPNTPPELLYGD